MYSKEKQLYSNRIRPTQKKKGSISDKVRREIKQRSDGVCERCDANRAVHMAHIISRKNINHVTTSKDLLHLCIQCHKWLDETVEGINWKRRYADENNLYD